MPAIGRRYLQRSEYLLGGAETVGVSGLARGEAKWKAT